MHVTGGARGHGAQRRLIARECRGAARCCCRRWTPRACSCCSPRCSSPRRSRGGCARGAGRLRRPGRERRARWPHRDELGVLAELGVRPAEADLTVVQFSTAFCGPCRATRARLQQLQRTRPGLAYVHVDAESHLDERPRAGRPADPHALLPGPRRTAARPQQRRPPAGGADRPRGRPHGGAGCDRLLSPRGPHADLSPHSGPVPRRQLPVSDSLRAGPACPDAP